MPERMWSSRMELQLCSILDTKSEIWSNPMAFQSIGQAMRAFGDAVNEDGSEYGKHPEDYILFRVGTWNQQTGELNILIVEELAKGINVKLFGGDAV